MKVFELLTPDQLKYKQLNSPAYGKWRTLSKQSSTRTEIGGGKFANVYDLEKDPGSVDKVAKPHETTSLERDGYYRYLDMISRNERISNNPYFPKVYNLETYRGRDGKYTYRVNLEKLGKLNTLSLEEILTIGRNLFTNFDIAYKQLRKEYMPKMGSKPAEDEDKQEHEKALHHVALDTLAKLFDLAIDHTSEVSTHITDSHLKKALSLIRGLVKSDTELVSDIHRDNIMVRRGPFTPQIVITDPLA